MTIKRKKLLKRTGWTLLVFFILMNIVAYFHAYKFTHFSHTTGAKTKSGSLSFGGKMKALFFGISNPRPENKTQPKRPFETVVLQSNKKIECWYIATDSAKGTVILFHGYGGEKSSMLRQADEFLALGYNTLLVDFMGSGGSEGNQTTIGFKEAQEVKSCFDYIQSKGEKSIYLFGTSLGASAILKSLNDYSLMPSGIMIECPFGSLYKTTCARFRSMGVPSFPMACLLDFWGGLQNGFWAFGYKPEEYAKKVNCRALLLYGEKDEKVSRSEIDIIYSNLQGKKYLKTFPLAGHEDYLVKYKEEWINEIKTFLSSQ
ncbi:MAG: lysophospholipase [Bacteroidetes bacterium]|jgi:pimeloyl-ACP methyl ester carboxylesterase|nr:MAG: lysophospholipase [Bacteroidota bacterium]